QSQHRLHHGNVMRLAVLQRRVRALRQTRGALRDIPAEPLVASLPADPVLPAQHRHLILARQNPSDKLYSLVHLTGRSPRHRQVPPAGSSNLSPIQPVNSVTYLLGPYTLPSPPLRAGEGLGGVDIIGSLARASSGETRSSTLLLRMDGRKRFQIDGNRLPIVVVEPRGVAHDFAHGAADKVEIRGLPILQKSDNILLAPS